MTQSVAELYAAYPFNRDECAWPSRISYDHALAYSADLHTVDDPVALLDRLGRAGGEESRKLRSAIHTALLYLPPEVVLDNFGEEVAVWITSSSVIAGQDEPIKRVLREKLGYNILDLQVAKGWEWTYGSHSSTKSIMAQYALMQSMRAELVENVDLESIIRNSAREGVELSDARIGSYSIEPIEVSDAVNERGDYVGYNSYYRGGPIKGWKNRFGANIINQSWIDAPTGFALMYKGLPQAVAGIAMQGLDQLKMYQMQGVKSYRIEANQKVVDETARPLSARGLMPIDWQKVMVNVMEEIAKARGVTQVGIQAGENNIWTKKHTSAGVHLPVEKAKHAYNQPAKRLGFRRWGSVREDWTKEVAEQ